MSAAAGGHAHCWTSGQRLQAGRQWSQGQRAGCLHPLQSPARAVAVSKAWLTAAVHSWEWLQGLRPLLAEKHQDVPSVARPALAEEAIASLAGASARRALRRWRLHSVSLPEKEPPLRTSIYSARKMHGQGMQEKDTEHVGVLPVKATAAAECMLENYSAGMTDSSHEQKGRRLFSTAATVLRLEKGSVQATFFSCWPSRGQRGLVAASHGCSHLRHRAGGLAASSLMPSTPDARTADVAAELNPCPSSPLLSLELFGARCGSSEGDQNWWRSHLARKSAVCSGLGHLYCFLQPRLCRQIESQNLRCMPHVFDAAAAAVKELQMHVSCSKKRQQPP